MREPLRGAIVGFGNVVRYGHLPAWLARNDVRLVAVVEPNPERRAQARALLPDATSYADSAELLGNERLDFVDIATPPVLHAPLITAVAAAGVHVLCEKPLVLSALEYREVCQTVARSGVTLFTVHNWKYSEPFRRVRALLDEGAIGPLDAIRFEIVRDGYARSAGSDWRTDPAVAGGGNLVDHGWHAFYLMVGLVAERPGSIRANLARRRYVAVDVEDSARCTIKFPSAIGRLDLTWAGRRRSTRWELRGRAGEIEVVDDRVTVRRRGRVERFACGQSLSGGSHHPEWFGAVADAFRDEITHPARRGRNLAEAGQCLQLLSLAYASHAAGGRWLALPGATETQPPAPAPA